MKVIRAEFAGACYGVQRALDIADEVAAAGVRAFTLGPLIHNPVVVADLEARGIGSVDDVDDIAGDGTASSGLVSDEQTTVIIRSHGVTPEVRARLDATGLPVRDATCPHVLRAQKAAAQLGAAGCTVVVVGEAGHPEVEGLVAYARSAGAKTVVAERADQVPADLQAPVGVVVQTTQRREVLDEVLGAIRAQGIEPQVKDTVCDATRERQDAAAAMAHEADAVVVIGGRNSANTTHLAEICSAVRPRTFHIQDASEIDPAWFDGCTVVGVTAGASTPESQIQSVVALLESL